MSNADPILVLDKGRIIERSTFAPSSPKGGLFARLVAEGGFTEPPNPKP